MQIRPAVRGDLDAIKILEGVLHNYDVDPTKQWSHFEENPDRVILLADFEGEVVGMVKLNLVYKLSKIMSYLDELVVHPSKRGSGVGSALMRAAEEWSWKNGADIIDFTSRGKHPGALEFYAELGYEQRDSKQFRKKREGYDGSS